VGSWLLLALSAACLLHGATALYDFGPIRPYTDAYGTDGDGEGFPRWYRDDAGQVRRHRLGRLH
jgi:hypothetical protein